MWVPAAVLLAVCVAGAAPTPHAPLPLPPFPYTDVAAMGAVEQVVHVQPQHLVPDSPGTAPALTLASYHVADLEQSAAWVGGDAEVRLLRRMHADGPWAAVRWLLRVTLLKKFGIEQAPDHAHMARRSAVVSVMARTGPRRAAPAFSAGVSADAFRRHLRAVEGSAYVDRIERYAQLLLDQRRAGRAPGWWASAASGCGLVAGGFPPPLYVSVNYLNALVTGNFSWVSSELIMLDGAKRLSAATLASLLNGQGPHETPCELPVLVLLTDSEFAHWRAHTRQTSVQTATACRLGLPVPTPPEGMDVQPWGGRPWHRSVLDSVPPGVLVNATAVVSSLAAGHGALALAAGLALGGAGRTLVHNARHGDTMLFGPCTVQEQLPLHGVQYVGANVNHAHFDAYFVATALKQQQGGPGQLWAAANAVDVWLLDAGVATDSYLRQPHRLLHFALFASKQAVLLRVPRGPAAAQLQWALHAAGVSPFTHDLTQVDAQGDGAAGADGSATLYIDTHRARASAWVNNAAAAASSGDELRRACTEWSLTPPSRTLGRWVCYPAQDLLAVAAAEVRQLDAQWMDGRALHN